MILRKSREFTVNMGNYESVKIGASIEIDSDKDMSGLSDIADQSKLVEVMNNSADNILEQTLAADIKEASELTSTRDSFILSWNKG